MTPHFHKIVPENKNAQLAETKSCLHPLSDDVRAQLLNENSMDSRVKGSRSIARLALNWFTYNQRNRSCLPPPLSNILRVVKVRRKIQAGWQEEIKVRKGERAPFILLDLGCRAFPLFLLHVSPRLWSHYKAKKEKKWWGTVKGPRREEALSYYSPCSTVRAWPAQTRWYLLQKFYKLIGESTVKSKTLNIPAEASPIFGWWTTSSAHFSGAELTSCSQHQVQKLNLFILLLLS